MGGNRHNRAGAVAHQHIVGNINGNLLTVYRIHRRHTVDAYARLLLSKLGSFEIRFSGRLLAVSADLLPVLQFVLIFVNHRMLRRHYHIGRPEQGVAAGCINTQLIFLVFN